MQIICGICYEKGSFNDELSIAGKCGHVFHTSCMKSRYINEILTCPLCRFKANKKDAIRLRLMAKLYPERKETSLIQDKLNEFGEKIQVTMESVAAELRQEREKIK